MSLSLEGFLVFAATIAALMWLAVGFGRLSTGWNTAQGRVKQLRHLQVEAAKELLRNAEEIERLKVEEKAARAKLAVVREQCTAKQKEMANFVAPAAPEIFVTSEYPPAKGDRAWTVTLSRTAKSRTKKGADVPGLPPHKQYLVWA